MKRILLLMTLVVGASCSVWADTACPLGGSPTADLATYIAGGFSCSVGDLTFSNFGYIPTPAVGGAIAPSAAEIGVTPIFGTEMGLEFTADWAVGPGQSEDSPITYTVTCDGCSIDDVVLSSTG